MAEKRKSSRKKSSAEKKSEDIHAQAQTDPSDLDVEEVEAELVHETDMKPSYDDASDNVASDNVASDDDLIDQDIAQPSDDPVVGEVDDAGDDNGGRAGMSPGVVFLAILAVIGITATGLWTLQKNNKGGEQVELIPGKAASDPLGNATSSGESSADAARQTSIDNGEPKPITGGENENKAKIANSTSEVDKETLAKSGSVDNLEQVRRALPPVTPEAAKKIKQASDEIKNLSAVKQTLAQESEKLDEAGKEIAGELSIELTNGAVGEGVGESAKEIVDDISKEVTNEVTNEGVDGVADKVVSEVDEGVELPSGVIDQEGVDANSPDVEDIATAVASAAKVIALSDIKTQSEEESDPVEAAADLFASNPDQVETPADQLGADPVAAIKQLQEEARAIDEDAAIVTQSEEIAQTAEEEILEEGAGFISGPASGAQDALNEFTKSNDSAVGVITENETEIKTETETGIENSEREVSALSSGGPARLPAPDAALAEGVANNNAANEKLSTEIAALEESFEERTQRITEALDAERERAAAQAVEIENLKRQLDDTLEANEKKSAEEIERLRQRIDQLQKREEVKAETTNQQTASLLALIAMQRPFDQGISYKRELEVLKKTMPRGVNFSGLENSADRGAPTLISLKQRFPEAIRTTLANNRTGAKGPIGHIMRNLQSLMSVRPATPQQGDGVAAIISRGEASLLRDDLAGAIEELATLEGAASASMTSWLEDARRRERALAEVRDINDRLLAGINN